MNDILLYFKVYLIMILTKKKDNLKRYGLSYDNYDIMIL